MVNKDKNQENTDDNYECDVAFRVPVNLNFVEIREKDISTCMCKFKSPKCGQMSIRHCENLLNFHTKRGANV